MSYEGYIQKVCRNGHYFTEDVYNETNCCPICHTENVLWQNFVDITNGSYDDQGTRIDGYLPIEVDKNGIVTNLLSVTSKKEESNYVNVEVDISDEDLLELSKIAHEKNITLNNLVCDILKEYVEKQTKPYTKEETKLYNAAYKSYKNPTSECLYDLGKAFIQWYDSGSYKDPLHIIEEAIKEIHNEENAAIEREIGKK
jgi:RNA polymerase subunit RPABC4/transcription elongation factor Spt4